MNPIFYRFKFLHIDTGRVFSQPGYFVVTAIREKAVMYASVVGEGAFRDWSPDNYSIILTAEGEVYRPNEY